MAGAVEGRLHQHGEIPHAAIQHRAQAFKAAGQQGQSKGGRLAPVSTSAWLPLVGAMSPIML